MKNVYVFLADGFEDVEAVTPIDYLRRAGAKVTVVGISGEKAVSAHGLTVLCDCGIDEIVSSPLPDLAVLPGGGPGSKNLASSSALKGLISRMFAENRLVGAICAAPAVALGSWGLLSLRKYTCYPGMGEDLPVKPLSARVVVDGNLITSRAPGTAEEFSLELVRALCGAAAAKSLTGDILSR